MSPEPRDEIDFDITPAAIFKACTALAASRRGRVALHGLAALLQREGIINLDSAGQAAWRVLAETVATLPID